MKKMFESKEPQLVLKLVFFCHFLKFGSLVFLEIAYNDTLQQCLILSRSKIYEKNWGPKFGAKGPKSVPKLSFLPFSQVWFINFA